jgi:hypothetical protein
MDVHRKSPVGPWRLRMAAVLALAGGVMCLSLLTFTGAAQAICLKPKITNVSFNPAEPVEGQPATIAVEVSNAGSTCESGPIILEFRPESSSTTVGASDELLLEANEETTVNLPYTFAKARVLPYLTVTDLWPADVNRSTAISTRNQYVTVVKPTFQFGFERQGRGTCEEYVCTSPSRILAGKPVTETVELFNESGITTPAFSVKLTPNAKGFAPAAQTQSFGSGPGGYSLLSFPVTYSKPGTYVVKAELLPKSSDFTTTGLPKKVEDTVTVEEATASISFQEGTCDEEICFAEAPVVDNKNTATVTVRNTGKTRSGRFDVELTPDGGKSQKVEELNPGESRTLSFPVTYHHHGSVKATARIIPIDFKNYEDEKTEVPVSVQERSAHVFVRLGLIAVADPSGYEEWDVNFCVKSSCGKKHLEPVLPSNFYSITEVPEVLHEGEKLRVSLDIHSTDYFCFFHCFLEAFSYPGKAHVDISRAEYLKGAFAIGPGEKCREGEHFLPTGPIVNGGKCYEADVGVELQSSVGKE